MFEYALKAHFPIIGVKYDDPLNLDAVLAHWAHPRKVVQWPTSKQVVLTSERLYHTAEEEHLTVDVYRRLMQTGAQLVYTGGKTSELVFDAGVLPTPEGMITDYLKEVSVGDPQVLMQALRGMSLRKAAELVQLSAAMTGEITLKSLNSTRTRLEGQKPGLELLDTEVDLWASDNYVQGWIELNRKYMAMNTPRPFLPRGMILDGPPGVGKSMAARVIAKEFGVPLFKLTIGTTLNKYIGESEYRLATSLDTLVKNAPCVALIDEVEKTFNYGNDENGTVPRMLGQLLWWLQERDVPVPLVMTTNALQKVPQELYREGRLDMIVHLKKLQIDQARDFSIRVLESLVGKTTVKQRNIVRDMFHEQVGLDGFSHSLVRNEVIRIVKEHGWA